MSGVVIALEDQGDGEFAFQVDFCGEFNSESHAHQHALLLIKHMDEIAVNKSLPEQKKIIQASNQALESIGRGQQN